MKPATDLFRRFTMKKPRKLIALPKLRALFAISLALAIVSARGQSREAKTNEGEVAVELFGLIAEQSGCSTYAIGSLDSVTQQVRYRCTDMLFELRHFAASLGREMRFLIDIPKAKAEYHQRFGNAGLPRPTSLVAYLLVNYRGKWHQRNAAAPMLIYGQENHSEYSAEKKAIGIWTRRR